MRRYRARKRAAGLRPTTSWKHGNARDELLAKADLIRTLARAHGATALALFGSAARGEERPGSDLDILVELEPDRSLLDLIGLSEDLQSALGRKVEAFTARSLKPRVLAEARKQALKLL
jgi:predicted nucleotidyltransferase